MQKLKTFLLLVIIAVLSPHESSRLSNDSNGVSSKKRIFGADLSGVVEAVGKNVKKTKQ